MTVKDFDIAVHPLLQVSSYTRQKQTVASSFSSSFAAREAPQDSDASQSKSIDWSPSLFFDVAYGCTALKYGGTNIYVLR